MGRALLERLTVWGRQIAELAANRQRQGLRVRSRRYDALTARVRLYPKNEINRVLNRLLDVRRPHDIAVESLDFRSHDLSRRMIRNRRLVAGIKSKCGRRRHARTSYRNTWQLVRRTRGYALRRYS